MCKHSTQVLKKCFCLIIICYVTIFHSTKLEAEYWQKITNLPQSISNTAYWLDIYFLESNPRYGWICGQNTNQVLRTTNSGNTWSVSELPSSGKFFESIHFADQYNGFCSGPDGVYNTNDGGISWQSVTYLNTLLSGSIISVWGCYMLSKDTIYVVGGGCNINTNPRYVWRSIDGGDTWQSYDLNVLPLPMLGTNYIASLSDIMMWPNGTGFISGSGIVYRTDDFGDTWRIWTISNSYGLYNDRGRCWQEEITNIYGTNIICVPYARADNCSYGFNDGGILWTNDGIAWNKYQVNESMYGSALVSPTEGWACGSNRAVYNTTTAGQTWRLANCGIGAAEDLDDIWFINDTSGWVIGSNIYRLAPTEVYVENKNINLGSICAGQTIRDTNQIYVKTYNNSYFELEIVQDNPHFNIIQPDQLTLHTSACANSRFIVEFSPQTSDYSNILGEHKFAVAITGMVDNESTKFIDTIFYTINVTEYDVATDKDTLNIGNIVLNSTARDTIVWTTSTESVVNLILKEGNDIANCCQLQSRIADWELLPNASNVMIFEVIPTSVGEYIAKYSFLVEPCGITKDIFVRFNVLPINLEAQQNYNIDIICKTDTLLAIPITNNGSVPFTISDVIHNDTTKTFELRGWGSELQGCPILIKPLQSDTLYIQISSDFSKSFDDIITLTVSDTNNATILTSLQINIKANFLRPSVVKQQTVLDIGDVCVDSKLIKSVDILYNGNLTINLLPADFKSTAFRLASNMIANIHPNTTISLDVEFSPTEKGVIVDTIRFTTNPCNYVFELIVFGRGILNEIEYLPQNIVETINVFEEKEYIISAKSISPQSIDITSIEIVPKVAEIRLKTNFPIELGANKEAQIALTAYSESEKTIACSLQVVCSSACNDTILIPISIRFVDNQIDFEQNGVAIRSISHNQKCSFEKVFDTIFINAKNDFILNDIYFENNSSGFTIESDLDLPVYITSNIPYQIVVSTEQTSLGEITDNLLFELEGDLSGIIQFDTIQITNRFDKAKLDLNKNDFDFGLFEVCNIPIYHTFTIKNSGNIADTCYINTTNLPDCIKFSDTKIVIEANDSATIVVTCYPDLTTPATKYIDSVQLYSTVCPLKWNLNLKYHCEDIDLLISPESIEFDDGWVDSTQTTVFKITNVSPFDIDITQLNFDNTVNFSTNILLPFTLAADSSMEIPITFISNTSGLFVSKINIVANRQCTIIKEIPVNILIPEEQYYATVEWNWVMSKAGDKVILEAAVIRPAYPHFYPDKIDINIKMDYDLFFPMKLFIIKDDNTFEELYFDFNLNDGISTSVTTAEQVNNLLNFERVILKLEGKALLSDTTKTPVWFDTFNLLTDKSNTISLVEGQFEIFDFCSTNELQGGLAFEPLFDAQVNNKVLLKQQQVNVKFTATDNMTVNYDVIDLLGSSIFSNKIHINKGITETNILLNSIPAGTYFIKFYADFNNPISELIIIAK